MPKKHPKRKTKMNYKTELDLFFKSVTSIYQQKLPLNNKLKAFGHIASPMYKKHF